GSQLPPDVDGEVVEHTAVDQQILAVRHRRHYTRYGAGCSPGHADRAASMNVDLCVGEIGRNGEIPPPQVFDGPIAEGLLGRPGDTAAFDERDHRDRVVERSVEMDLGPGDHLVGVHLVGDDGGQDPAYGGAA